MAIVDLTTLDGPKSGIVPGDLGTHPGPRAEEPRREVVAVRRAACPRAGGLVRQVAAVQAGAQGPQGVEQDPLEVALLVEARARLARLVGDQAVVVETGTMSPRVGRLELAWTAQTVTKVG